MNPIEYVRVEALESLKAKEAILADEALLSLIARAAEVLAETYRRGGKSLWAGNGGSAADAQHMAAELVNKFRMDRRGLPALALTVDTSILTAVGNDYGYERVFAKQIEALGAPGDVFVGISTSGRSANLVACAEECRKKGIFSIALLGASACPMDEYDLPIHLPSTLTPRIQECQTLVGHILCGYVEQLMFSE